MCRVIKDIPPKVIALLLFVGMVVLAGITSDKLPAPEAYMCVAGLAISCRLIYWQAKYYPDDWR